MLALIIVSGIFLCAALGVFAWLVVERYRYYKTGDDKRVTLQYAAALISIFCIFVAIAFFGWARLYMT